jgi:hypothetical protein
MTIRPVLALMSLLTLPGCWVWIDSHPRHVEEKFTAAIGEVAKMQAIPAAERGRPHKVRLLVYEEEEDRLISLSVPIWLVRRVAEHAAEAEDEEALDRMRRHGVTLDQILEGGRGVVVQAEEDNEKVLVWLE